MQVCSTQTLYHTLLNAEFETVGPIMKNGLRPLSDFPDSERWQQIEKHMPGFYKNLYEQVAQPVLKKPYSHSGIFVSPIDFQKLPESLLYNKTRLRIPIARLDPAYCVLTYVLDDERVSLSLTSENLEKTAEIWDAGMVQTWFAKDRTKLFFYVPQVAIYQPQAVPIEPDDLEEFLP
jgi:hypothetical protein